MISFTIPRPASGKNRRRIIPLRGKFTKGGKQRHIILPSKEAADAAETIKKAAHAAILDATAEDTATERKLALLAGKPIFGDDDVQVLITHFVHADEVGVIVTRTGPRPKGKTGRRSDLHNMADVICDAMQGIVYDNDNQVVRITMERIR